MVQRLVRRYHYDIVEEITLRTVAEDLQRRGLCKIGHSDFQLLKSSEPPQHQQMPSRFMLVASDEMHIQLLRACDHCCGAGFRNRNVAARKAVRSLMFARFNTPKTQFDAMVSQTIAASIIEEVPSKGTTAFRLTEAAKEILNPTAVNVVEDTGQVRESITKLNAAAVERYGDMVSEPACRFVAMFQTCCEVHQIRLAELFRFCAAHGMKHQEVRRAIGELHTLEYVFVEWCENSGVYFLTMCNLDSPNRSMGDLPTAFADMSEELRTT